MKTKIMKKVWLYGQSAVPCWEYRILSEQQAFGLLQHDEGHHSMWSLKHLTIPEAIQEVKKHAHPEQEDELIQELANLQ